MNEFTAIIPFHNEGEQIFNVLRVLTKVTKVTQIIAIDDASTDNKLKYLKNKFPNITSIRLSTNLGKAGAVRTGVERARNEKILMLDADYHNLSESEISTLLNKYLQSNSDMLLMRVKGGNNWFDRLLRKEVLFSGFRILKKQDLLNVFKLNPRGYQLEVAINKYMINNQKNVYWTSSVAINIHKIKKWGTLKGLIKSISMELSILSYLGLGNFAKQVLTLGKKRLI